MPSFESQFFAVRSAVWKGRGTPHDSAILTPQNTTKHNNLQGYPGTETIRFDDHSKSSMISGQIIATSHLLTPNGGLVRGNPLISGKSRLVKYYNLAR